MIKIELEHVLPDNTVHTGMAVIPEDAITHIGFDFKGSKDSNGRMLNARKYYYVEVHDPGRIAKKFVVTEHCYRKLLDNDLELWNTKKVADTPSKVYEVLSLNRHVGMFGSRKSAEDFRIAHAKDTGIHYANTDIKEYGVIDARSETD